MNQALITLVWERARHYCEYCCLPAMYSSIPFEVDHIIARKHGGRTTQDNLALACFSVILPREPTLPASIRLPGS